MTRKLISIVLAMCMIMSCFALSGISASAATATDSTGAITGGQTVYLKPNSNWLQANARFAMYYFGSSNGWVDATKVEDGIYSVAIPAGSWSGIIFTRMNPATTENNWNNKWNQTNDITSQDSAKNMYVIADNTWDKGGGSWDTYTPAGTTTPVVETTAPVVETTAPVVETTAPASDTITVKFTDGLNWGSVNVYYWNDGPAWPGTAMEKDVVNDYGQQVYKATIPAAATGVIFNGGGAQTVDITTGIADGAQWYPTGEWENGKAKVGYVEPENPTTAPETTVPETTAPETTAPETTVPETTTPDIKNVYVDFTNVTDAPGHAWFAWTWNDNEEGTWEYVQKYGYVAVKDNVLFANFESTEVERKWDNVLAQTVDVAVKDMADDTLLYVKNEKDSQGHYLVETAPEPTTIPVTTEPDTIPYTTVPETTVPTETNYYLFGWINGANYACEEDAANMGEYKFEGGDLMARFAQDSYVAVKTEGNANWYMTDGYPGDQATSATLKNTKVTGENSNKLKVPGNTDVRFTLVDNGDDTFTLSYVVVGPDDTTNPGTTAPTTVPETTEPITTTPPETITVKFTDTLGWGSANVYYWTDGPEWPGTAMEKDVVNDYGQQVYKATIPAGVTGIIFNGGSAQTVDITTNIVDGAQWYPTGEWEDGKAKVEVILPTPPETTEPVTTEPVTTEPVTTEPVELTDGYYVIKPDWSVESINAADKFASNEGAEGEYMLNTTLTEGDKMKVVKVENKAITDWYPNGYDTEYTVDAAHAGSVTIYFKPEFNGDWADFGGFFYIAQNEEPTTEEPTTVEPTTEPTTQPTTSPNPEVVDRDGVLIVADNFNLILNPANGTRVIGEVYLNAGEYKFRVQKDRVLMGYNAAFTDNTPKGYTYNAKFKAQTTLTATGGIYRFQFDTSANALIVKKVDTTTPPAYLTGDLHTILKPVLGKEDSMASGSIYVAPGTYEFKVVNGINECGYNTTINDTTGTAMLSVNPKFKANMKLVATGGVYTFTLFTKTNKFKVSYVNDSQESKTDVHIAGLNIVLDDNDGESNIATATATVAADTYQIKVYNYGVIYTAGENLRDSGTKALKTHYTTPLNFTASGGDYFFSFNKTTGKLTVQKLAEVISVQ